MTGAPDGSLGLWPRVSLFCGAGAGLCAWLGAWLGSVGLARSLAWSLGQHLGRRLRVAPHRRQLGLHGGIVRGCIRSPDAGQDQDQSSNGVTHSWLPIPARALEAAIAATVGTHEPIIAAGAGETPAMAPASASQMSRKHLKTLRFQCTDWGRAFLDSPPPKHYGPRGFEDGRNPLDLLATPQCRTQGR